MNKRILLIANDKDLYKYIRFICNQKGYELDFRYSDFLFKREDVIAHDLIVLGLKLSSSSPLDWNRIRSYTQAPVLLVTDSFKADDMVIALSWGVDEYVKKPWKEEELRSRIEYLLHERRHQSMKEMVNLLPEIRIGSMTISTAAREVTVGKHPMECTPREFALLYYFASHCGAMLTRKQLLEDVWGKTYSGSMRTVDTHVKELRRKLEALNFKNAGIITVWGKGYKFNVNNHNGGIEGETT